MQKAQFWSFDVIFAIVIFSTAITILGFVWYSINNQFAFSYSGGTTVALLQSESLAQQLLSPGYPSNWQGIVNPGNTVTWTNVSVGLGATTGSSSLSTAKIYALLAMSNDNYNATKQPLGVGYDYEIIISGRSMNLTIGKPPPTNGEFSVYVQHRSSFLNGAPATVTVLVWASGLVAVS